MDGKEALCTGLDAEASSVGSGYLQQSSGCAPDRAFPAWTNGSSVTVFRDQAGTSPSMDGQGKGLTTPSPN